MAATLNKGQKIPTQKIKRLLVPNKVDIYTGSIQPKITVVRTLREIN